MGELKKLPIIVFLSNAYENYKKQQDELTRHKINFLFNQAYQYLYPQFFKKHIARIGSSVDFHPSIYAKKDATAAAIDVVMQVAADGRVNQCYQRRVKELKSMGVL